MSQDLFKLGHGFNCVPQGDERIALRLYFKHAATLLREFDRWKDIDRFYFIPLKLNMTYSIGGHSISMADGTIHLGTFVRNSLEHPDLFSFRCPKCGEPLCTKFGA